MRLFGNIIYENWCVMVDDMGNKQMVKTVSTISQDDKTKRKLNIRLFGKKRKFTITGTKTLLPNAQSCEPSCNLHLQNQRKIGMAEKEEKNRGHIKNKLNEIIMQEHINEYCF